MLDCAPIWDDGSIPDSGRAERGDRQGVRVCPEAGLTERLPYFASEFLIATVFIRKV